MCLKPRYTYLHVFFAHTHITVIHDGKYTLTGAAQADSLTAPAMAEPLLGHPFLCIYKHESGHGRVEYRYAIYVPCARACLL